jgi:hypothetical protein
MGQSIIGMKDNHVPGAGVLEEFSGTAYWSLYLP